MNSKTLYIKAQTHTVIQISSNGHEPAFHHAANALLRCDKCMTVLIYTMHLECVFKLAHSILQVFTQQHERWTQQRHTCLQPITRTGLMNVRIHSVRPFLSPMLFLVDTNAFRQKSHEYG